MDETYFLQASSMVFLSFWKTYIGPLIAAASGFAYWEMLLFNLGAALTSVLGILGLTDFWMNRRRSQAGFNGKLRKALRLWRRYGNAGSLVLAPVLIGIPTYTLIARRLKTPRREIIACVTVVTTAWCSLFYWAGVEGLLLVESF